MQFSDFMIGSAIRADLSAEDETGVIRELVGALAEAGDVDEGSREEIVEAVLEREKRGTTALGHDAALPHAKHPAVKRTVATLGISREGVDFHAIDRENVHLVFLVLSPPERPSDHLHALDRIARQLRDRNFCRFLKEATTAEDVENLLNEADRSEAAS